MALSLSLSDLEEQLEAIRAKRLELLGAPLKHATGRSSYDNSDNIAALDRQEQRLINCIRAKKRALGLIRPAAREVY